MRFEHVIARHKIRELREKENLKWYELTPEKLLSMHTGYFQDYISDIEVTDMNNILEKLIKAAPTEGRARAAYDCYVRIRMMGYEQAKVSYAYSSWRRHVQYLKSAGLKRTDLQAINVIPLRKRAIELSEPVRHWDDIKLVG